MRSTRTTVATALAGAVFSGAVSYYATSHHYSSDAVADSTNVVSESTLGYEAASFSPSTAAERLDTYARIGSVTTPRELEAWLERITALPTSTGRDFEIRSLLSHLLQADPASALRAARRMGLHDRFIVEAFSTWAELDPDAALAAVSTIEPQGKRYDVLLALLDVLGNDTATATRFSTYLLEGARTAFLKAALIRRAEEDPLATFSEVLALPEFGDRQGMLGQLGTAWGRHDPIGALAQAQRLASFEKVMFVRSVLLEWTRLDPEELFRYIETVGLPSFDDTESAMLLTGLRPLIASDAERALRISDRLPRTLGDSMAATALEALIADDPAAAAVHVETLPAGARRTQMLEAAAASYARRDRDAAMRWANGLVPPSAEARVAVIAEIALDDARSAWDLLTSGTTTSLDPALANRDLVLRIAADPRMTATVADALANAESPGQGRLFQDVAAAWIAQAPNEVLDWMNARTSSDQPGTVAAVAQAYAGIDVEAAAENAERVPAAARDAWLSEVASVYADRDLGEALAWIEQYRGQPFYELGLARIMPSLAEVDPRRAATMLTGLRADAQMESVRQVGTVYAGREPAAAALWAETFSDANVRSTAIAAVVPQWAFQDTQAASEWVLDLPIDAARDRALGFLLMHTAAADLDPALIAEFSSSTSRDDAIGRAIVSVARQDIPRARALVDSYARDPELRRRIEAEIAELLRACVDGSPQARITCR